MGWRGVRSVHEPDPAGLRTSISSQRPSPRKVPMPKLSCACTMPRSTNALGSASVGPICSPPTAASYKRKRKSTSPVMARLFWLSRP
jgi:hypothetical protein